jgi:hypothetical protein
MPDPIQAANGTASSRHGYSGAETNTHGEFETRLPLIVELASSPKSSGVRSPMRVGRVHGRLEPFVGAIVTAHRNG